MGSSLARLGIWRCGWTFCQFDATETNTNATMRYLNVPMIEQESSMSCWHASARMLWGFKYRQSINPMNSIYQANTGVGAAQFVQLAKTLGLASVESVNMSYSWKAVAELLRRHGPLWVAGVWYGAKHIIVVTGVDPDGTLYVNDPGFGPRVHNIRFFNQKIAFFVKNPIMYLPDSRANAHGYGCFTE